MKGIKLLNKRAAELQKNNEDVKTKLDKLEQYNRRQNLRFHGVPATDGENVTLTILEMIKKLDVNINENDISIAYRSASPLKKSVGKTRNCAPEIKQPLIIVRFVSR